MVFQLNFIYFESQQWSLFSLCLYLNKYTIAGSKIKSQNLYSPQLALHCYVLFNMVEFTLIIINDTFFYRPISHQNAHNIIYYVHSLSFYFAFIGVNIWCFWRFRGKCSCKSDFRSSIRYNYNLLKLWNTNSFLENFPCFWILLNRNYYAVALQINWIQQRRYCLELWRSKICAKLNFCHFSYFVSSFVPKTSNMWLHAPHSLFTWKRGPINSLNDTLLIFWQCLDASSCMVWPFYAPISSSIRWLSAGALKLLNVFKVVPRII